MEFKLTKNQQDIYNLIEKTNDNIAVLGKPGTGKSVLINTLIELGEKSYIVCAPTGLAALNVGGKTLHTTFQIPVFDGIITPEYVNNKKIYPETLNFLKFGLKHLIIDEISMVRADQFDYIDRFLRDVKCEPSKPFGGVQVIAVGDFFQLPPVTNSKDLKQFKEYGYESPFVFDSKVFSSFKTVTLGEVLRQKGDKNFIDILHSARTGEVSPKHMVILNERVNTQENLTVKLVAVNKQSDYINQQELRKISSPSIEFHADCVGTFPAFPVEPVLELKVGALVMVKKNFADRNFNGETAREKFSSRVVNGTIGTVVDMNPEEEYVTILTRKGEEVKIYRQRWERKVREKNEDGKMEEKLVASFEQIPLSLAWAISMHKSQGQTFDAVHIDASKVFAAGQLYVALSRCKSLDGITLQSRLNRSMFYADPHVLRFTSAAGLN